MLLKQNSLAQNITSKPINQTLLMFQVFEINHTIHSKKTYAFDKSEQTHYKLHMKFINNKPIFIP